LICYKKRINIIYKLINRIIFSNNFDIQQKKKIINNIAEIEKNEKPNCKGIYILEAILSKIIIIYHNIDTDEDGSYYSYLLNDTPN
jgi:repressor of nif and glnA expression